ncbi:innexin inx2 [Eurytemora carolleeae]|uniref:innexin inx2 n=1 Tax=Eurytemora carolleeae TaxID=1294199 RepID=UPI000C75B8E1|nr:innexin inx2 [Eurytemora carolleeae]|eukprot:XP_023341792.1 innexin inx2-like [Eurytemora affinis]
MYEAFKGTKKLLSRKPKVQSPRPDNFVFRLHYQFTFGFLAIAVLLVTGYSYIDTNGSAIQCMMDKGIGVPAPVINSFCWIMSTYSLPKYYNGDQGTDFIHHGVGPQGEDDEEVYHAYYQWVPLFLSFQAVMFYLPHYIWKVIEGGRFRRIVAGLNLILDNMEYSDQEIDLNNLATYMNTRVSHGNKGEHISWAIKFYLCEVLNFINVVVQIVITDRFLGGSFYNYGIEAASWSDIEEEDRVDPMYKVFPRMTKCMFHKYGGSGTLQKFDALCVLGMNIINEKIFVFLWFWYVFLATVTAINLIMRISQFMSSSMRFNLVKFEEFGIKEKQIKHDVLENVLSQLSFI